MSSDPGRARYDGGSQYPGLLMGGSVSVPALIGTALLLLMHRA